MTLSRTLFVGSSQLVISNGIVRLLAIATTPILTNLLSPQAYGVAALAGTGISLIGVFAFAGIDMSYARAYHSKELPSGARVESYCWRFAMLGALVAAVFALVAWWSFNSDSIDQNGHISILVALGILFSAAHTMAQTRARLAGRYRAMAISSIIAGVVSVAASIGIAASWRQDALALVLPMLLGYLLPVLLLGVPSIAQLTQPSGLSRIEGRALIKIGLAGVATAPMYWLLSSSDRWFLQYYLGAKVVGVYSIGYSVAVTGMMVNNAVTSVWLPEAAREYEQNPTRAQLTLGRLMSRVVILLALVWLVIAAAGGDIVRWLANERFHAAMEYVPYIAGGVFFYGVSQIAFYELVVIKQAKWAAMWWLIGGLICTLLNLLLVPRYGGVGAAIAQTGSFGMISLAMLATSQAKFRLYLTWGRLLMALLLILIAGVLLIPPWHRSAFVSLLMKLPIGIAVAFSVTLLIAPDWCARGIEHLRRLARRFGSVPSFE